LGDLTRLREAAQVVQRLAPEIPAILRGEIGGPELVEQPECRVRVAALDRLADQAQEQLALGIVHLFELQRFGERARNHRAGEAAIQ
jgi:hypothetical protein